MALQDEITRIKQAKADIKASIEAKGGTVGNGTIDTYASAIDNLPSGGSGGEDIYEYFSNVANAGSLNGRHLIKKLPMIDTSNVTSMNSTFDGWNNLEEIPLLDTSNVTSMSSTFRNCAITTIPAINTQNVSKFDSAFYGCSKLYELPTLNFKSVISSSSFVYACSKLTILGGFTNIGQAYLTTQNANYSSYVLNLSSCSSLTHDSLMNVINNLYDIASAGVQTQQLYIGSSNKRKLTAEEIAIATNKGWTVL